MILLFVSTGALSAAAAWGVQHAMTTAAGIPATQAKLLPGWQKVGGVTAVLALVIGFYLLAVRWGEDRRPAERALSRFLPEWTAGLAIGGVLMVLTVGVMAVGGFVTVTSAPVRGAGTAITNTLQSGVFEELLLRLIVFRLLWRAFGPCVALALSALLFGALHLANPHATPVAALAIAFEAGIMLAAFYMLTGRIWMSIGVHMGWNFTQGWVLGALVSGGSGFDGGPLTTAPEASVPDWLDGGGFGPEAGLPALLICTAVGLWVLRSAWATGQLASPSTSS